MEQSCIRVQANHHQINRCQDRIGKTEIYLTKLASVIGLIGNDTRLRILYLLQMERKLCVCDLSNILNMTVPAISQQLKKLKNGGIINSQREGTIINYSVVNKYSKMLTEIIEYGTIIKEKHTA